tara:strand:- start:436 stop:4044 length:3609 start_codon:yes stop_codon:yes gene_type:complete
MKTFFCNRTVDKSEMKRLIKWVLLNYGTQKATRFVDHLKTLGFHSATLAGISLGIDDLRIPPVKSVFLKNAEKDILDNDLRYTRGQITAVERLEKALDIWNTTNDTLKNEVIAHFRETDIFNPVYMMAFSGARGNISQVRQLVGMRGLMADQQGQVLDFPIRRNFREGLTVTEYMISCYGARKGLVDTALRTANSGYLTRRLVDVAQSVIIQQVDCETTEGLEVVPSEKNEYANIMGRVLLQPVIDEQTGKYLARKNTEISPALAAQLVKLPKVVVRSALTCRLNSVCQLCYGWDLSKHRLVQLGEAVGVLAAQSIGEPGTQLTMRTFHTGGVFAGEATEKVYAPYSGIISYSGTPRGRKVTTRFGEPAFLTVVPVSIKITRPDRSKSVILQFPPFTLLFVYPGQYVMFHQSVAELSRIESDSQLPETSGDMKVVEKQLLAPDTGQIYYNKNTAFTRSGTSNRALSNKSLSQVPKVFAGYGFIWILSGLLLRNNLNCRGDYFHKTFQPFTFKPIADQSSLNSLIVDSYQTATEKLLKYQENLSRFKTKPFISYKTVYKQQQQLFTQIDQLVGVKTKSVSTHLFVKKRQKFETPVYMDRNFSTRDNLLVFDGYTTVIPSLKKSFGSTVVLDTLLNSKLYNWCTTQDKNIAVYGISTQKSGLLTLNLESKPVTGIRKLSNYPTSGFTVPLEYKLNLVEVITTDNYQLSHIYPTVLSKTEQDAKSKCSNVFAHKTSGLWRNSCLRTIRKKGLKDSSLKIKLGKACFRVSTNKSLVRNKNINISLRYDTGLASSMTSAKKGSINFNAAVSIAQSYKNSSQICQTLPLQEFTQNGVMDSVSGDHLFNWNQLHQRLMLTNSVRNSGQQKPNRFPLASNLVTTGWPVSQDSLEYQLPMEVCATQNGILDTPTKNLNFYYGLEGEIRLPGLAVTKQNQHAFKRSSEQCLVSLGQYLRVGDELMPGIRTPYGGQVIHIDETSIILRRVYSYAMSSGSSLLVDQGQLIQKDVSFGTLLSFESDAGDIVQGLPKVDELLEAREPVEKIASSMHAQLATLFLFYSKTYGLREGCRRSLQEVRRMLVNEVQAVYGLQGVFISDKHIEIIVRQMTTYVLITDPGETNLLPGDVIDLRRVEHFEAKKGLNPVQYRPILLGITRASLAAESFIAAASFQETKRVLTRAAVEGQIDWLTGLKENVILGRLIPAGTGLYV